MSKVQRAEFKTELENEMDYLAYDADHIDMTGESAPQWVGYGRLFQPIDFTNPLTSSKNKTFYSVTVGCIIINKDGEEVPLIIDPTMWDKQFQKLTHSLSVGSDYRVFVRLVPNKKSGKLEFKGTFTGYSAINADNTNTQGFEQFATATTASVNKANVPTP